MTELLELAIKAAIEAGKEVLEIYELPTMEVEQKGDDSPLTLADKSSNDIINQFLSKTKYPIISEENKQLGYEVRKNWDICWIVDPLDGTKEFIKKNGEFTVNIAFCEKGLPVLGVIYVPVSRELYYTDVNSKEAFKTVLDSRHQIEEGLFNSSDQIVPSELGTKKLRVVGSRSHMNQDTTDYIESAKKVYDDVEIVSKGSSLKFCLVAEGKADIYPRFAPTMEWDTAAGHAICLATGLKVTSQETQKDLLYNKEDLLNPYFLVSK